MSSGSPSFDVLRRAADQLQGSNLSSSKVLSSLSQHLPPSFTWSELARELAQPEDQDKPHYVLALRASLEADPSRIKPSGKDSAKDAVARRQICRFLARMLTPIDDATYDAELTPGEHTSGQRDQIARRCKSVADDGLAVLERVGLPLADETGHANEKSDDTAEDHAQTLYTITALADAGQPWTTDTAAAMASRLLTNHFANADSKKSEWIADGILKQYLRPLFARSRPATVTESGRKAAFASNTGGSSTSTAPHDTTTNRESHQAKPWKYVDMRAISVFAWAVHEADGALVRTNWPLFVPVLLALVEDADTPVRARGLGLLTEFVAVVPDGGGLLHSTGLDSVLADAVFPTLLFLPRLTPENESLQLLGPAYSALLSLAKAAGAGSNTSTAVANKGLPPNAAAILLDRILREGIYAGYFHASEHIHIVEELMRQAGRIVEAMGIYAVKHLKTHTKDLMPMYAAVLTDPFAMRYKPAVAATLDALQTTLTMCWPRLVRTPWQEETLKMLMLCWLHVVEEEDGQGTKVNDKKETAGLKVQLVRAANTLLAIFKAAGVDINAAVRPLVESENRLVPLFRIE
ncbi:uncharacterized protein SPSK_07245 [Sporothrix schenckii 1099-18]|uniref:Uncharacterized protein n=1 Tax=Sporothrix schenckii 1099-18 TaxID=1397361 RepID=A0A0F2MFN6_SPOSC|nr:uncharacterized protein SPSK_07245 [Sporothrix schenckii 1099-18]KJR87899.1 hypothetical protein SPSK_07245 [Sporothrix schenckii 1099-18]